MSQMVFCTSFLNCKLYFKVFFFFFLPHCFRVSRNVVKMHWRWKRNMQIIWRDNYSNFKLKEGDLIHCTLFSNFNENKKWVIAQRIFVPFHLLGMWDLNNSKFQEDKQQWQQYQGKDLKHLIFYRPFITWAGSWCLYFKVAWKLKISLAVSYLCSPKYVV